MFGLNPSLPSIPSLPAAPVAPVGPVAPDGIPRVSFLREELQETVGLELAGNGEAVTKLIGELSTALQTTWNTPEILNFNPDILSVPEQESAFRSKEIVGPSKLLGITILNFPLLRDTDALVPDVMLTPLLPE
jgi:hypothetical protein